MSESIAWRSAAMRAVLFAALLALVSGGPRPEHRTTDHPQKEPWIERVQHPVLNDAQYVQYPSLHDTQWVQFPSMDDGQRCAAGHYLDRSGLFARCVPCSCNGHSNECEQNTGRCLNCQDDTAGEHCERCREGYYHSDADQTTCRVCPCPFSREANNFAVGCTETRGTFQCLCKEGHSGERCERCAPGYYGDPLAYGGRCRLCNCAGNLCDPKTGVCRNYLEIQDTNTDEQCEECDNCAQTLLKDLEKLEVEMRKIKNQLDSDPLRPSSKEHLRKLEEAIAATTNLVNTFNITINNQIPKINQLAQDVINMADDMDSLKVKVGQRSEDSQKALANAENSHQRAKDLDTETQNLLIKIQDLLKLLLDRNSNGTALPSPDLTKLLEQAEKMVKEMERRNFTTQNDAAKKEQAEANKFLENVKNITEQCDENEAASKRVDGLLSNYETKLKELEDLLKQADNMVKNASDQNDVNGEGLKGIQKRLDKLAHERDVVGSQIALAVDQLKVTEDLLKMFNDSKTEYEQLAAQLNRSKTELQNKVQVISQAAAKEDIVKQAEKHAEDMYKLAKMLQEALQNVSGRSGVQTALSGIEAYKNITDAINAAEEAAKKAKEAADKALNDVGQGNLVNRARDLKNNSSNLFKDAINALRDLQGATKDLRSQNDRLIDAESKKTELEKELLAVQDGLRGIQRDDIGKGIDAAKEAAANANRSASDTMDQLKDINAQIANISISPPVSNMDKVLNNVEMTVKNLSGSVPSLLDKIEALNSQIGSGNNVTENIKKIKELIEQAREAANRIVVPMKFTGKGYVEMRPPQDLDDLRAYTSLTLSLQRPEKPPTRGDGTRRRRQTQQNEDNLFVMYLGKKDGSGDFIGMALRNNILHVIYKLNGKEYDIETTNIIESKSDLAVFDKIDLYRIYQDAQVVHTQQFTSKPKPPLTKENLGELTRNLLDLSPENVVFYVGGYPDDFTPPASLNYGKYNGCIEFSTFSDKFISLYNFKNAVNINLETPCKRQLTFTSQLEYFEGTGYAKFVLERFLPKFSIEQRMKTPVKNALLLYLGDENDDFYHSVSLEGGHIVLRGREKDNIFEPVIGANKPSLSEEIDVKLYITEGKEFVVRIGNTDNYSVKRTDYIPQKFNYYYIGGIPNTLRERYNITIPALKGCVKVGYAANQIPEVREKVGIGKGCSDDLLMIRQAKLSLGSSLEKPVDFGLDDVNLSLGFSSKNADSILLQTRKTSNNIELSMENGYVVLKVQEKVWKSNKQYQDGKWHYLTVGGQGEGIELRIDEEDVAQRERGGDALPGPFPASLMLGRSTFQGCMSNLYHRGLFRPEDLNTYTSTGDVLLSGCSATQNM